MCKIVKLQQTSCLNNCFYNIYEKYKLWLQNGGWGTPALQQQRPFVRKCCKTNVVSATFCVGVLRVGAPGVYSPHNTPEPHSASTVWGTYTWPFTSDF